jgi:regulator of replication initiation timing
MKDAQAIFNSLAEAKKQLKEINREIKAHYEADPTYVELLTKRKVINQEMKPVRMKLNESIEKILEKKDDLKIDISGYQDELTDIALISQAKGQPVEIKDNFNQLYLPIFKAKFEKQ